MFGAGEALVVQLVELQRLHEVVDIRLGGGSARVVRPVQYIGHDKGGQHTNDDQHHHQFNQRKTAVLCAGSTGLARGHKWVRNFHGGVNHNRAMQTLAHSIWWPRGASFILAALAAGSASFWALKVSAVDMTTSVPASAGNGPVVIDPVAVTRALGGGTGAAASATPAVSLSSRFAMLGVLADLRSAGAALISVDGRPAKPYRVGDVVDDGLVLQSVKGRSATLGSAATGVSALTLELPAQKQ